MPWEPESASVPLEEEMEAKDLPEGDRDELRRLAKVLRRMKAKRDGEELPPPPDGMVEWLKGEE